MSDMTIRVEGELAALSPADRRVLLDRSTSGNADIRERTAAIIGAVRTRGDSALRDAAREYDGVADLRIEVSRADCEAALAELDPTLRAAMDRTVRNLELVQRATLPQASEVEVEPGVIVGRRPDALQRVGVYAPGGRAAYPSSVLMGAIPARVAGVEEVIVCTPPGPDGLPTPVVMAAAALAGVDRVFAVGGAGAVAAMAYGTATIPRVDRIVGPGNAYVAEAKLQLVGQVAIDAPAGPSELLIIADAAADADWVAAEAVGQAEHDPLACVVIVVVGPADLAARVRERLTARAARAPRREVVLASLAGQGGLLRTETMADAIAFANAYASEHLLLASDDPTVLADLRGAGTVFVGGRSSVAFGDYMSGANHVLPTGGLARSYSGLSALDFVRWTTWQRISAEGAASLAPDVARFARAEGLPGHADAALVAGGVA